MIAENYTPQSLGKIKEVQAAHHSHRPVSVLREEIGYPAHLNGQVGDLRFHKDVGGFTVTYCAQVPSQAVVMVEDYNLKLPTAA